MVHQKRKLLWRLLLALLVAAGLRYALPGRFELTASAGAYIDVLDGLSGAQARIADSEEVSQLVQQLNDLSPIIKRKVKHSENGYLYVINIFSAENEAIGQFTILDNSRIVSTDYCYTADTSRIVKLLSDLM